MTSPTQCWSFSQAGKRCELAAGHEDAHLVNVVWTDAEAWTPTAVGTAGQVGVSAEVPVYGYPELPTDLPDVPSPTPNLCPNCDHKVHDGPCTRSVKDALCGCTFRAV